MNKTIYISARANRSIFREKFKLGRTFTYKASEKGDYHLYVLTVYWEYGKWKESNDCYISPEYLQELIDSGSIIGLPESLNYLYD